MNLSMIFFLLFNTKEDISKNYGNPLTFVSHIVEVNGFKVKISSFVFFWNNRKLRVMQLKISVCMCAVNVAELTIKQTLTLIKESK